MKPVICITCRKCWTTQGDDMEPCPKCGDKGDVKLIGEPAPATLVVKPCPICQEPKDTWLPVTLDGDTQAVCLSCADEAESIRTAVGEQHLRFWHDSNFRRWRITDGVHSFMADSETVERVALAWPELKAEAQGRWISYPPRAINQ